MSEKETIIYVEAYHEEQQVWKPISKQFIGVEDDIRPEAEAIMNEWLKAGWPKDQIRISKSDFKHFNKKWRED